MVLGETFADGVLVGKELRRQARSMLGDLGRTFGILSGEGSAPQPSLCS